MLSRVSAPQGYCGQSYAHLIHNFFYYDRDLARIINQSKELVGNTPMSIRRLRTLIAVAESGSFAGAAEAMFVSQSAVSMQMRALERELHRELFDRSKRPPVPNAACRLVVDQARSIVAAYDAMARDGPVSPHAFAGELDIGAVPTTLTGLVPKAISSLQSDHPGLHIRIASALSAELLSQVSRRLLDAALISEPVYLPPRLHWQPLAAEPLVLEVADDITSDDPEALLRSQPFIRFNRRAWVGRLIDDWLHRHRIEVSEVMELDTLEAVSTMVSSGLGVSIVPLRCAMSAYLPPVRRLPLGPDASPRILGLLCHESGAKRPVIELFFDRLVRIVQSEGVVPPIAGGSHNINLSEEN